MYEIKVIPIDRRYKRCKCENPCAFLVEFSDISGYVVKTLCLNAAKSFAFAILDKLVQANSEMYKVRKDRNTDKRWTEDEEKSLQQLRKRGLSYGQIGIKLGRSAKAVKEKIARMEVANHAGTS